VGRRFVIARSRVLVVVVNFLRGRGCSRSLVVSYGGGRRLYNVVVSMWSLRW
jgi:hypothetical protein